MEALNITSVRSLDQQELSVALKIQALTTYASIVCLGAPLTLGIASYERYQN